MIEELLQKRHEMPLSKQQHDWQSNRIERNSHD